MSTNNNTEEAGSRYAASCGISCSSVSVKECKHCDLAWSCIDECQQEQDQTHSASCKDLAALRDELLFRQPEGSYLGECPLCCLPMPFDTDNVNEYTLTLYPCCGRVICNGCSYAYLVCETAQGHYFKCPFCRQPLSKDKKDEIEMLKKRAKANDSLALAQIGKRHMKKYNYKSAFKYLTRAATLGDADAHFNLSFCYLQGKGVEKDKKMELYHLEEAAIAGHLGARHNLGCIEVENKRFDRAVKHWIIAANLGDNDSIQALKECYKDGLISKDDLAAALRAHQEAVDATKSPQRETAAAKVKV